MVTISDYRRWAKEHPNFMTPWILKVKQRGNTFIELSEGTGFQPGTMLYGVSIRMWNGSTFVGQQGSDSFTSKQEALKYFNRL